MRIIHTADLHLGYRQYGMKEREQDFYKASEHVFKRAVELKADVMILAGDIFDAPKPPAVAVNKVCGWVAETRRDNDIAIVGIDGNHDSVGGNWLGVCDITPLEWDRPLCFKGITIAGFNADRAGVFKDKLNKIAAKHKSGVWADIFVMHQALGEMADFKAQELTALELAPILHKLGVRYVAMGDIHDYKEMVMHDVRFVYSGDVEVNAINEQHEKSFSIIDIDKDSLKTSTEIIPTRNIAEVHLDSEQVLDTLLNDKTALLYVWFDPENRDLALRAESLLRDNNILYRMHPLSKGGKKSLAIQMDREGGFERAGALQKLKQAITEYFDEDSEQYQLVLQLLDQPDNTEHVVQTYMTSKGLKQ